MPGIGWFYHLSTAFLFLTCSGSDLLSSRSANEFTHAPDTTHDSTHDSTQDSTYDSGYDGTAPGQNLDATSKGLGKKLLGFLNEVSGIETLQKAYDDAVDNGKIRFGTVAGDSLIDEVATSLGSLLGKKVEALKAAVKHAEYLAEHYEWNKDLKSVGYLYAVELNESADPFQFSSQYNRMVSFDNSSVHIPIDIYRGSVNILNAIAWTDGLSEVWIANKQRDPSLLWQYFGSQTGVLRTYPASKFDNSTILAKLYDVRRQPWYTQGVSSPKDMLILIEKSGSSRGQALTLMKHSVMSIMETLGENDFVNIAEFSDKVKFSTCFSTFVQATDRNKRKLISFLDNIAAGQVANYTNGFEFAFKQFANFSNSNDSRSEGANCNQVIMLLTDGDSEVPVEIFRRYNSDKKIRIFTFAVGPVSGSEPKATKQIGCMNRGYFYKIPAMGAIRSTVQDYLSILADPLALASDSDKQSWTSVHRDSVNSNLIISVTMPVFNRSRDNQMNQTILGVMGVDVSVKEMMDIIPSEKLGPNGYAFAINSNGFVLFHPDLQNEEDSITSPMIDFAEIEDDTPSKEKIRMEMIDQIPNKVEITDFVIGLDERHAEKRKRTYHYAAIPGTKFSVAVVLPDYVTHYVESTDAVNWEDGQILLLSNYSKMMIDFQKYCQYIFPAANISVSPASTVVEFLEDMLLNISTCDSQLLQQLLFDAEITSSLEEFWTGGIPVKNQELQSNDTYNNSSKENNKTSNSDDMIFERNTEFFTDGIIARFVSTNNDFTRVYPPDAGDFFENQLEPSKEVYYKRSFDSDGWIFYVNTDESSENVTARHIMATKAVSLTSNNYKIAVVGIQLTLQRFHDLSDDFLNECSVSELRTCYILDDGGVIVASNDEDLENSVGKFLSDKDSEVMEALINDTVFERHRKLDFQGMCTTTDESSAGFRLLPPFIYEILSLNWWTTASTWSYVSLMNIYSWLFVQVPNIVEAADDPNEEPCIKALLQHHLTNAEILSEIECNNCTRSYKAFQLQGTNLLVVSIDGERCGCKGDEVLKKFEIISDPLIDDKDEEKHCSIMVRYRRRPPCYEDSPFEPESHCSAYSFTASLHLCLMLVLSFALANIL